MALSFTAWAAKNPGKDPGEAPWGSISRWSMLKVLRHNFTFCVLIGLLADTVTLSYIYFTRYIIRFIQDEDASTKDGAILCAVFSVAIFFSSLFKN